MRSLRTWTITAVAGIGCIVSPLAAQQYNVTNLGNLTGFTFPSPTGINNPGQVVGGTNNSTFTIEHAFRTSPNAAINPATDDLGLLPGATSAGATGINNLGQVSGTAGGYTDGSARAFRADPGNPNLVNLGVRSGVLSGLPSSNANGINDAGQVTGNATVVLPPVLCSGFNSHAFRTQPNGPLSTADDLGTLNPNNCGSSVGIAINASGQVAGFGIETGFIGFVEGAFLANPGQPMVDIGTLGGNLTFSGGINNAGQVVGRSNLSVLQPGFYETNAFLKSPGSPILDLGTLGGSQSSALGINKAGQIVGSSSTPGDAANHAFLYQNGSMYDLNNLIPAGTGWILESASAINDLGQIVGNGTLNGVFAAFRLDPVVAAGTLPPNGNNCNGTYQGAFNQSITVSSGQTCRFLAGSSIFGHIKVVFGGTFSSDDSTLNGDVDSEGGDLNLNQSDVEGNLNAQDGDTEITASTVNGNVDVSDDSNGGTELIIDPSTIKGNLTIHNLAAGSAINQLCGTKVDGNVTLSGNAAPVTLGRGIGCGGNTVRGNVDIQNNTAAATVTGNTVLGNVQVQNNTAAATVTGNTISGNLSCSGDTSITGSGNMVKGQKSGQCASF